MKDLNGMTTEQFLKALEKNFTVEPKGKEIYHPSKLHNFSLYLDGQWYSLTAKPGTYDDNDPIGVLDVTVLSNLVLDQLLDIKDLRTSKRIDFVGGIRGLEELKKRVDSGEMKAAFALYPVSMQQAHRHCRYGQHHASEDHLVRAETPFGCGDPYFRGEIVSRKGFKEKGES